MAGVDDAGFADRTFAARTLSEVERAIAEGARGVKGTVEIEGHKVQGLALPEPVLRRLFRDNALRWVPGWPRSSRGSRLSHARDP